MLRRFAPYAANTLTAARVIGTPLFIMAVCAAPRTQLAGVLAVLIFAAVAASDVWDGRLARRWASVSRAGRVFDHLADITFILAALSTYALIGLAPWWVPAAIGASFAFYVFDSWVRTTSGPPNLIGSRIGHTAGVLNYVLIGVLVCNNTAGIGLLPPSFVMKLFWLVPLYSSLAVIARLAARREMIDAAPVVAESK